MDRALDATGEMRSRLTAAILFLCTAGSMGCAFYKLLDGVVLSPPSTLMEAAARVSPVVFSCASALLFFRPRLGYSFGLLAGLIALPWFVQNELSPATWNSWVILDHESPIPMPPEEQAYVAFTKVKILSVTLVITAGACSVRRLLPAQWLFRKCPLYSRTWPAFAIGFLVLTVWFACSVTPYNVPAFDHAADAELRILHVEKRGLSFHETTVTEYRDGKALICRSYRRLFQYRFEAKVGLTALAETSPVTLERVTTLVHSQALWNLRTPAPTMLRSWNAEGWYVALKDARLLAFAGTQPPKEITELFHQVENLPARDHQLFAVRDVCLGFCYDPVAALGFGVLPHRIRLLRRNASGSASRL